MKNNKKENEKTVKINADINIQGSCCNHIKRKAVAHVINIYVVTDFLSLFP